VGKRKAERTGPGPERLWAPWRMEYVTGYPSGDGCFFCKYWNSPADDQANLVLARGERCYAVLNRYPYNGGHLMVVPALHASRLQDLCAEALPEVMRLVCLAERTLRRELKADGFNVGFNIGRPAGAGVKDHLHMHVVPRWEGDTNFMPVLGDTRVVPVSLERLWELLAPAFAAESGKG
jgi:ATP adenylyltransferase